MSHGRFVFLSWGRVALADVFSFFPPPPFNEFQIPKKNCLLARAADKRASTTEINLKTFSQFFLGVEPRIISREVADGPSPHEKEESYSSAALAGHTSLFFVFCFVCNSSSSSFQTDYGVNLREEEGGRRFVFVPTPKNSETFFFFCWGSRKNCAQVTCLCPSLFSPHSSV